eukprot:scaffold10239_cov122-Isochrysis_galbana.AAC.12
MASTWAWQLSGAQKQPSVLPRRSRLATSLISARSGARIQSVYCRMTEPRLAPPPIEKGLPHPYFGCPPGLAPRGAAMGLPT